MLVEFSVGNYQAFGTPQRVPIKPITLIFGPNGAGKSALLKSLLVSQHAVLDGELYKSKGASDRHPGTFKAMQRNKLVPEMFPEIQFGWTLRHGDNNTDSTENLNLLWSEITANSYNTNQLALYRNGELMVHYIGGEVRKFGPCLERQVDEALGHVLKSLVIKGEEHCVVLDKLRKDFMKRLGVEFEGNLFPGTDLDDFDEAENSEDLQAVLNNHVSNHRQLTALIKGIQKSADDCRSQISMALSDFREGLSTELESLVYHGPIRPVYDEINATDISDSQMGEWLKLAEGHDLCGKVNDWLASTAGNSTMKVIVSRLVTMHDVASALGNNIRWEDVLASAYGQYMFARYQASQGALIHLSDVSSIQNSEQERAVRNLLADQLAHDATISAFAAEFAAKHGIVLPAHYKQDANGKYAADLSAIPIHLRHRKPNPIEAWEEYEEQTSEQSLDAARAYHALLVGRGEMKRIEDFLLQGIDALLSQNLERLENPHQATDLHKVLFIDSRTNKAVQASNLGLGFSQMLPLVISAFSCEDQLIVIEQPELHVHPALQTELADLFIQSATERKNRFLIETHSEHLILRVMRRIRETTRNLLPEGKHPIRPEDVAVLYVQPGENGSTVQELRIDEQGRFVDNWPQGFFEERLDEMF